MLKFNLTNDQKANIKANVVIGINNTLQEAERKDKDNNTYAYRSAKAEKLKFYAKDTIELFDQIFKEITPLYYASKQTRRFGDDLLTPAFNEIKAGVSYNIMDLAIKGGDWDKLVNDFIDFVIQGEYVDDNVYDDFTHYLADRCGEFSNEYMLFHAYCDWAEYQRSKNLFPGA